MVWPDNYWMENKRNKNGKNKKNTTYYDGSIESLLLNTSLNRKSDVKLHNANLRNFKV